MIFNVQGEIKEIKTRKRSRTIDPESIAGQIDQNHPLGFKALLAVSSTPQVSPQTAAGQPRMAEN